MLSKAPHHIIISFLCSCRTACLALLVLCSTCCGAATSAKNADCGALYTAVVDTRDELETAISTKASPELEQLDMKRDEAVTMAWHVYESSKQTKADVAELANRSAAIVKAYEKDKQALEAKIKTATKSKSTAKDKAMKLFLSTCGGTFLTFNGTAKSASPPSYSMTVEIKFETTKTELPHSTGTPTSRSVNASIEVSGTVHMLISAPPLSCNDTQPFTASVLAEWGADKEKSQPLRWKFTDTKVLPLMCEKFVREIGADFVGGLAMGTGSMVGVNISKDQALKGGAATMKESNVKGIPSATFLPYFSREAGGDIPPIPTSGADPDKDAVLDSKPFSIHYSGRQVIAGMTRTYDLTANVGFAKENH